MFKLLTYTLAIVLLSLPVVTTSQSACTSDTTGKSRAQLESELEACNREIEEWTQILNKTKSTSASFERDIQALTAKINAAQASIKAKNIAINNLSRNINSKQSQINILNSRIIKGQEAIAHIIRKTNDINNHSLVETLLSDKDLSDFFVDIDTYASTERALAELFKELRGVREQTEEEKASLNRQKELEASARAALEVAKKQVEVSQKEKEHLLAVNKNKEKTYGEVLADRQAKATQIRAVLFPLRDAGAIPFGTALQYAQTASAKTGVEPALILAILQQESNLGANVGSCVVVDLSSGKTRGVNSGTIFTNGIHPTRDLPVLQSVLSKIGRDPLQTKVSCPIAGVPGYGGAMGPAQFIPSTWQIMESKVGSALGRTPDPWSPPDAIMAMAMFLGDLIGNTGDLYVDQRTAACRYYSGRTCYGSNGPNVGLSYGNSVMSKAASIQQDIDFLQGV